MTKNVHQGQTFINSGRNRKREKKREGVGREKEIKRTEHAAHFVKKKSAQRWITKPKYYLKIY